MPVRALLRLVVVAIVVGAAGPVAARAQGGAPPDSERMAAFMFDHLNRYWFGQFFGSDDGLDYDLLVEYHVYDFGTDWAARYRCPEPVPDDNAVYCPQEQAIFLDRQLMEGFAAEFGPWSIAFAMAHEWGHHIQWTVMNDAYLASRSDGELYKLLELQADCFAGAALRPLYDDGLLRPEDLPVLAAFVNVVGDDRGAGLPPSEVARLGDHGVGAERVAWFQHGLKGGDFETCMP